MHRNKKIKALRAQISKLVEEYAAIALASNTFVPGTTMVQPSLTKEMIEFSALKIRTFVAGIGVSSTAVPS